MKSPLTKFSFLAVLLFLLSIGLCGVVGCNTSQQKIAFNASSGTQVTIEAAMTGWSDYVKAFHPPDATRAKVKAAYQKYQKAAVMFIDTEQLGETLAGNTNASPADILATSNASARAQAQAAQALADLVDVLRGIGVKI